MDRRTTLARWVGASLPVFCVLVVILWRAQWISKGVALAIFLVSLVPLAAAKAFLLLREREGQMRDRDLQQ